MKEFKFLHYDDDHFCTDTNGECALKGLSRDETVELNQLQKDDCENRTRKDGLRSYASTAEKHAATKRRQFLKNQHDQVMMALTGKKGAIHH